MERGGGSTLKGSNRFVYAPPSPLPLLSEDLGMAARELTAAAALFTISEQPIHTIQNDMKNDINNEMKNEMKNGVHSSSSSVEQVRIF